MTKLVKKTRSLKLIRKTNGNKSYWFDTITLRPWAGRARNGNSWYIYGSDGTKTLIGNSEYADAPVEQLDNIKPTYSIENLGTINKGLQALGRPLNQRAAVMGNIFIESGGDPETKNGSHYGIMQWDPIRYESKDPSLLRQIQHADSTLRVHGGNEWVPSDGRITFEDPNSTLSLITNAVGEKYERPGEHVFPKRIRAAQIFRDYFATPRDSVGLGLINPMFK